MKSPVLRELPALLKLSWPLVLTQLAQVGIVFTDVIMMGLLGTHALAGAGLGGTVYSFLLMFSLGVITVITNLVTSHKDDHAMVKNIVHAGLLIAVLLAIVFGILLWHIKPILIALGQEVVVADTAMLYLRALLWGMLPNLIFMTLRAFTIGIMQVQLISAITLGAMGLNIILNLIFIYAFPSLGVMNLGIASSLVFLTMCCVLILCVVFNPKLKTYRLLRDTKFFTFNLIGKILRLGVPMGMIFTFEAGFFVFGVFMAGLFGVIALAAHNVAIQLAFLTYMVSIGIANATSVKVSEAFGSKQFTRIKTIGRAGVLLGILWMSIPAVLFWLIPEPFIYLFTYFNMDEMESVFSLAVSLLMIAAFFQLFDGMQGIIFGILRGLEEGLKPMFIAIIGYWCIGAPMAYLFAVVLQNGVVGVWWGLTTGLTATALLGWIFFETKLRKLR
jgi:multidrug resistance protein, MATE family